MVALNDEHENVRRAAVQALGELGEYAPVELLVTALGKGNVRVREAVVQVLAALEEKAPIEPLLAALHDEDRDVRREARFAVERVSEYIPVELLLVVLYNKYADPEVRMMAARALAERGQGAHIPLELPLTFLDVMSEWERLPAVRLLGKLGARAPVEPLVAALGDSVLEVREAAAQALQQTHPNAPLAVAPEAIAILEGQGSGAVLGSLTQGFIAETMMNMGHISPALFEKLTQLLDWPHWQLKVKAAQAMGKLRRNIPDAAIRRLLELRHDPQSRAVRQAADEALMEILSLETGIEDD